VGSEPTHSELQEKVRAASQLLAEVRFALAHKKGRPLADWLSWEQRRAARYNHYFALLLMRATGLNPLSVLRVVSSALRDSDVTGVLDKQGWYLHAQDALNGEDGGRYGKVGIIMPETNRGGVETVARRLSELLPESAGLKVGMAVYPDDAVCAEDLLRMAGDEPDTPD
jgi:hypothetical protein